MQFRDLQRQYQALKKDIDMAMLKVAEGCNFIGGMQVKQLETELAEYVGVKHCITCANGTDALTLALMAWGVGKGDAVFVPDFTFFASAEVVSLVGAAPVFTDVKKETFNIDPCSLELQIQKVIDEGKFTPKVVIAVDLFGLPAEFDAINKIAQKYNLKVLEDGAQGFGGSIYGKKACSFGDISITSFFPAKPLGCYGDGGAVFTDNNQAAVLIESLKVHGKGENKYDNIRIGLNSRLDTIQAAILLVKLKAFKEYELTAVNSVADRYTAELDGFVEVPKIEKGYYSSWAQYTIRLENKEQRDELQTALKEQSIPSMIYYQKPMHMQGAFKNLGYCDDDFANAWELCDTVLSLPMHPYLSAKDIEESTKLIKKYLNRRKDI
ncbi:UDP-4-amino-4-deoxy-L-arabinose--oxoglutarate aminotransferase [uncultured Eubacterium sp.]|nr:UDP-4-amino-4-deoxy-L-arabinose--oxoglutarate aminotransferase [uncultured Eubacterium sp.]